MDDKVSLDELIMYIKTNEISIELEKIIEMFNHATSVRRVTQASQY